MIDDRIDYRALPETPGKSYPRLLFMAMPNALVLRALVRAFERTGLLPELGGALFAFECWHQSLSGRFADTATNLDALLRAGGGVSAQGFVMTFNRFRGTAGDGAVHWSLRTTRDRHAGLDALLLAVQQALTAQGLVDGTGHTPHVTVSYRAPSAHKTLRLPPVQWRVDELLLVRGHGSPYRYDVIGRWPLQCDAALLFDQAELF